MMSSTALPLSYLSVTQTNQNRAFQVHTFYVEKKLHMFNHMFSMTSLAAINYLLSLSLVNRFIFFFRGLLLYKI